jgi:hypothetical protein
MAITLILPTLRACFSTHIINVNCLFSKIWVINSCSKFFKAMVRNNSANTPAAIVSLQESSPFRLSTVHWWLGRLTSFSVGCSTETRWPVVDKGIENRALSKLCRRRCQWHRQITTCWYASRSQRNGNLLGHQTKLGEPFPVVLLVKFLLYIQMFSLLIRPYS